MGVAPITEALSAVDLIANEALTLSIFLPQQIDCHALRRAVIATILPINVTKAKMFHYTYSEIRGFIRNVPSFAGST
jgi:hypothetical protein